MVAGDVAGVGGIGPDEADGGSAWRGNEIAGGIGDAGIIRDGHGGRRRRADRVGRFGGQRQDDRRGGGGVVDIDHGDGDIFRQVAGQHHHAVVKRAVIHAVDGSAANAEINRERADVAGSIVPGASDGEDAVDRAGLVSIGGFRDRNRRHVRIVNPSRDGQRADGISCAGAQSQDCIQGAGDRVVMDGGECYHLGGFPAQEGHGVRQRVVVGVLQAVVGPEDARTAHVEVDRHGGAGTAGAGDGECGGVAALASAAGLHNGYLREGGTGNGGGVGGVGCGGAERA